MGWSACCDECGHEWDEDSEPEGTEPPENCPECGSADVQVEGA